MDQSASSTSNAASTADTHPTADSRGADIGLLVLRVGVGAASLQAGLIKALDFSSTTQFMAEGGWRLPTFAAFMLAAAETLGGIGLLLGAFTPLAACAVVSTMLCAWAVNVSGAAFWAQPFNAAFLIGIGAAALLFAGAGAYSVDRLVFKRRSWPPRLAVALFVVSVAAAVITWVALYGVNPIHFTTPPA